MSDLYTDIRINEKRFYRRFDFNCPLCGGHKTLTAQGMFSALEGKMDIGIFCSDCRKQVIRSSLPINASDEEIFETQKKDLEFLVNYCKPELKWKYPEAEVSTTMSFSKALELCMQGKKISREDWNGKGMYVYFVPAHTIPIEQYRCRGTPEDPTPKEIEQGYVNISNHFDMMNAQGLRIIGWLASQTDMASDKWYVVE